jgi:hypothetical protein
MKSPQRVCGRLLAIAVLFALSPLARGNTIVVGNHNLLPNTPGQVIHLTMTGTDLYSGFDLLLLINGGSPGGPAVTHVFGQTISAIPTENLAGSVWEGGLGGVAVNNPVGTTAVGTGYETMAIFATTSFPGLTSGSGIVATLTLDTTGVAPGVYSFSLTDNPVGQSKLHAGIDLGTFDPIYAPLTIFNGTLTVVPEPASVITAALALAGLLIVARRRRMVA